MRRDLEDPARARALADFVWWGLHTGQVFAPGLYFATLPPEVVASALDQLSTVRVAGQPAFDDRDARRLAAAGPVSSLLAWFTGGP